MSITNEAKPTTTLANSTRISIGETWASIPYTWAGETRAWDDCISLIDNASKVSSSMTNISKP